MDHPIAVEPVVAADGLVGRIWSIAVVGAIQLARDLADDLEIVGIAFHSPWGEVALQERVQIGFTGRHRTLLSRRRLRRPRGRARRVSSTNIASRTKPITGESTSQKPATSNDVTP